MKKQYLIPQTGTMVLVSTQLMAGSYTPGMNINGDPISGNEGETFYGN